MELYLTNLWLSGNYYELITNSGANLSGVSCDVRVPSANSEELPVLVAGTNDFVNEEHEHILRDFDNIIATHAYSASILLVVTIPHRHEKPTNPRF